MLSPELRDVLQVLARPLAAAPRRRRVEDAHFHAAWTRHHGPATRQGPTLRGCAGNAGCLRLRCACARRVTV
eukprot:6682265-Alexandrium_andersonii.AAC.1